MARKVKCPYCGFYFDRDSEEGVNYKNRWYHKNCYDAFWEIESVRIELIDFILHLFNLKSPGPKIYSQINLYQEKWGLTYKDILQALQYFYEVEGNSIEKANGGIGIVPHVYDEAQRYFKNKENRYQRVLSSVAQYKQTTDASGHHIVIEKEKITERNKHKSKKIDIDNL